MRATLLATALLLAGTVHAADPAPAAAPATGARIDAAERRYDAGKVDHGTTVRHTFLVKNLGTADLTIDAKPG